MKNGVITWENQQTDYPSCGPDMPEYEPRGCPRGASFSWYEYSPLRIKYPYIRGKLWDMDYEQDRVAAWASIVENEDKAKQYKQYGWTCAFKLERCYGYYRSTITITIKNMVLTELLDSHRFQQCR